MITLIYDLLLCSPSDEKLPSWMEFPQRNLVPESDSEMKRRSEFHRLRGTLYEKVEAQLSPLFDQLLMLFNVKLVEDAAKNMANSEIYFHKFPCIGKKVEVLLKKVIAPLWIMNLLAKYKVKLLNAREMRVMTSPLSISF